MTRVIDLLNDELKLKVSIGQGYDGFVIWSAHDSTITALNYMMNRAQETGTKLRVVDEHYYDLDGPEYTAAFRYHEPSDIEMKNWLKDNHPRYYKGETQ